MKLQLLQYILNRVASMIIEGKEIYQSKFSRNNLMNRYDNLYEDEPSTIMPNDDMKICCLIHQLKVNIEFSSEDEDEFNNATLTSTFDKNQGYSDIGDPIMQCQHCGACMWYQERKRKHRNATTPKFELCCGDGRVQLPLLESPPPFLHHLLFDIKEKIV
ncbi:hypothetical protein Lal_00038265 [Lupinus albus]|nr:hypothetical protein Lal_00038265 [Lupinus albus]